VDRHAWNIYTFEKRVRENVSTLAVCAAEVGLHSADLGLARGAASGNSSPDSSRDTSRPVAGEKRPEFSGRSAQSAARGSCQYTGRPWFLWNNSKGMKFAASSDVKLSTRSQQSRREGSGRPHDRRRARPGAEGTRSPARIA